MQLTADYFLFLEFGTREKNKGYYYYIIIHDNNTTILLNPIFFLFNNLWKLSNGCFLGSIYLGWQQVQKVYINNSSNI